MEIRQLSPHELPGLAQAGEAALGRRFPTAEQLVAPTPEPRLVSAVVAGDEIVAAALADLRHTLRALACATRLLARRPPPARERAIIAVMRKAIRQAEASLSRLPSRTRP